MYYVYVICDVDGNLYVGYSSDLKSRIKQHNNGENKSTKGRVWKLVYYEAFLSKKDAVLREKKLKQRGQAKRFLKERIKNSQTLGITELGARLKAPSRLGGR